MHAVVDTIQTQNQRSITRGRAASGRSDPTVNTNIIGFLRITLVSIEFACITSGCVAGAETSPTSLNYCIFFSVVLQRASHLQPFQLHRSETYLQKEK